MKFWRQCEAIVLAISVISFCSAIYLSYDFVNSRSKVPDPSQGRVYMHDVHGQIAYLNKNEFRSLNGLFWIAGISLIIGIAIDRSKRPFQ